MTDQEKRREQLWQSFRVELEERTEALHQLLHTLEHADGDSQAHLNETFNALFRAVHSVKGAARAVSQAQVEQWAHAFEAAVATARQSGSKPGPDWLNAARGVVAAFEQLGGTEGGTPLPRFPAILETPSSVPSIGIGIPEARCDNEVLETVEISDNAAKRSELRTPASLTSTSAAGAQPGSDSVRVSVGKLDTLLAQAGELAVTHVRIAQRLAEVRALRETMNPWRRDWAACRGLRTNLRRASATTEHLEGNHVRDLEALLHLTEMAEERSQRVMRQIDELASLLYQDVGQLSLVSKEMEAGVLAVRLLPVSTIFAPLERVVRDLARTQGKEIRLVLGGLDTEIDRNILEQLRDPLLHMVRNATDHGIELPDARQASGKSRSGTIRLSGAQRGGTIEIELEDDGAGLDLSQLRRSAASKGIMSDDQARALDDQAAMALMFRAGVSTKSSTTEISGRGVGMDVVREHLERLGGKITLASVPGKGTTFTIRVPLTLATTRAVLVEQSGQIYAIPSAMIERTSRVREQQIVRVEGRRVVVIDGHPVPVVELADILEQQGSQAKGQDVPQWRPYFVLHQEDGRAALLVDQLVGEQEIVVQRMGWPLRRVRNVSGAAVLGSGQTVAILNTSDLLKSALRHPGAGAKQSRVESKSTPVVRRRRVLVVDDSLPTRTLERSILEVAGYLTAVASNGEEALQILRREQIDLVVSDIEMPRLDGFGLTAEIRRDEKLRQIPVVLVTSLAAPEHRERGASAGADAYIVKGSFDQGQLLDTVGRLIA